MPPRIGLDPRKQETKNFELQGQPPVVRILLRILSWPRTLKPRLVTAFSMIFFALPCEAAVIANVEKRDSEQFSGGPTSRNSLTESRSSSQNRTFLEPRNGKDINSLDRAFQRIAPEVSFRQVTLR
jgi:hypothetical protein